MSDSETNQKNNENFSSYKFILGEMGIQILIAISRGATTQNTIRLLSGVPSECIHGRLPVLASLKLIYQMQDEIHITDRGHSFLVTLEKE